MADQKITQLTEDTAPQPADLLATVDDPGGTPLSKKATIQNVLKTVSALTADTTPDPAADYLLTYDNSASTVKKVLIANATSNKVTTTGNETIAGVKTFSSDPIIPDEAYGSGWNGSLEPPTKNAVYDKVETMGKLAGDVVQAVYTAYATKMTGTTVVPLDDTVPTSSEGTEISGLSTTITPTSATNILQIDVILFANPDAINYLVGCLFQDSGAAAICTAIVTAAAVYYSQIVLHYEMVAGTTSATTFKFRCGGTNAGTITFNGRANAREFGGTLISSMRVTEIKV